MGCLLVMLCCADLLVQCLSDYLPRALLLLSLGAENVLIWMDRVMVPMPVGVHVSISLPCLHLHALCAPPQNPAGDETPASL